MKCNTALATASVLFCSITFHFICVLRSSFYRSPFLSTFFFSVLSFFFLLFFLLLNSVVVFNSIQHMRTTANELTTSTVESERERKRSAPNGKELLFQMIGFSLLLSIHLGKSMWTLYIIRNDDMFKYAVYLPTSHLDVCRKRCVLCAQMTCSTASHIGAQHIHIVWPLVSAVKTKGCGIRDTRLATYVNVCGVCWSLFLVSKIERRKKSDRIVAFGASRHTHLTYMMATSSSSFSHSFVFFANGTNLSESMLVRWFDFRLSNEDYLFLEQF